MGGLRCRKQRGISNAQAKELGALRRKQGKPYDGRGLTYQQAQSAIADAKAALRNPQAFKVWGRTM